MAIDVRRAWTLGVAIAAFLNAGVADASLPNAQSSSINPGGGSIRASSARSTRGKKSTRRALAFASPVGSEALAGDLGRFTTTGNVRQYALYFFAGALALFWWMIF